MYSNLIDQETYAAVVAAAPKVKEYKLELAREIVGLLLKEQEKVYPIMNLDPDRIRSQKVGDLAAMLLEEHTPAEVGGILRELGLVSQRKRDGFHVYWSTKQIEILTAALGVSHA